MPGWRPLSTRLNTGIFFGLVIATARRGHAGRGPELMRGRASKAAGARIGAGRRVAAGIPCQTRADSEKEGAAAGPDTHARTPARPHAASACNTPK